MTFDEELTQAFDTLTARLRGQIGREVERRAAEVSAAAAAARVEEPPPPPVVDASLSLDRLARGFDAIDAAGSLTAILDALLAFATEDTADARVWLMRDGQPHRWRAPGSADSTGEPSAPSLDEGMHLRIGGQTVATLVVNAEMGTQNSELALLARYAAKSLEAVTAFTTARALTQPRIADRRLRDADRGSWMADGGSRTAETESEDETSAKRYARLLVSEIKLYHEPAVVDGRRDRDLATRLGGEIARARVMYEERVPAAVRERRDYFQEELVRTLADGDSSLLELRT